jgi:hypothetical protein
MFEINHQALLSYLNNLKHSQEAIDPNPIPYAGPFHYAVHGHIFRP